MTTATTSTTTKVSSPVIITVAAPKTKVANTVVSAVVATPVLAPIAATTVVAKPAQTTTTLPGADSVQPVQIGVKIKITSSNPVAGVAQHTVTHY